MRLLPTSEKINDLDGVDSRHCFFETAMPSKNPQPTTPSPVSRPGFSWEKIDALWAAHGTPLRPKVVMRIDPKTGKTVFTNVDLVPELAPKTEETNRAASPSSEPCVAQSPEESTTKKAVCDASPAFCDTSEIPSTPAVLGDDSDSHSVRPQNASSAELGTANSSFCDTSSDFCDASKTPLKPAFAGFDEPSIAPRPHKAHSDEFVTTKKTVCGTSSAFCDTPETSTTPVFSGLATNLQAVRPHNTSSLKNELPKTPVDNALEVHPNDFPEIRIKKLALKIFQNGGSYKTAAANLGISRDKARTWKRLWQIGRFEDSIRGIRFSGEYSEEIKAKVRKRFQAGATPGELEKEFKIPRQTHFCPK